jgi:Carboxypeptidase regulatory-like domain
MRRVLVFFGIVIVFSLASSAAMACMCGGGGGSTPCESYGKAAAVFVGTVTGARESEQYKGKDVAEIRKLRDSGELDWGSMVYKFSVEQAYLGVAGSEVEIFTGRGSSDCGFTFQNGQRYLVYAHRYKDKLITSTCMRTKPFDEAAEDIAYLGTLSSAQQGVTIHGTVGYPPVGPNRPDKIEPLSPDISIAIEGEAVQKEIRPDAEGRFSVSGLRPGRYKVALRLPETLTTPRAEEVLTLAASGCGAVDWYILDNGRVNGRVLNADGEPVPRIMVSLIKPGSSITDDTIKLERTNDDGYFSFSAVPRGTYNIAVNFNRFPEPNDPTKAYPPSFYPGVVDQRHAQAITVGPGEKLRDFEIRMPSKLPDSVLSGTVVWADGSPVANAQLLVMDVTNTSDNLPHGIAADEQGRFKINGYSGQKLIIAAMSNPPTERPESLRITLERPTHTVRIVITKPR